MLDDVGLVIRRARRMPPLDAEDFEEADRDGQCDCLHIEGGHGPFACYGTIGTEVDMIAAIDELHEGEDPDDSEVGRLAREFGAPVTINGMPVDPDVDEVAVHPAPSTPMSPYEDTEVAGKPGDPDTREYRWAVLEARQKRDHHNLSKIKKINPHKGPGRERGREKIRAMRESLAA